jgi:hypothetical protein
VLFDLAVVILFVLIGRHTHDRGSSLDSFLRILWPFGVGVLIASLAAARVVASRSAVVRGAVVAAVTTVVAMSLRVASGQGTAAGFVIVSLVFLGAGMIAWRVAQQRWSHQRR